MWAACQPYPMCWACSGHLDLLPRPLASPDERRRRRQHPTRGRGTTASERCSSSILPPSAVCTHARTHAAIRLAPPIGLPAHALRPATRNSQLARSRRRADRRAIRGPGRAITHPLAHHRFLGGALGRTGVGAQRRRAATKRRAPHRRHWHRFGGCLAAVTTPEMMIHDAGRARRRSD